MLEIFKLAFNDKIDKQTHPEIETDVSLAASLSIYYNLVQLLSQKDERFPQPSALSVLQIETSVEVKQRFPAAEMFPTHLAKQNGQSAICRVES